MRTVIGSTPLRTLRTLAAVFLSIVVAIAVQVGFADEADAKKKRYRGNPKYAAIVIDAKTGKVLHSRNANARRYPASLTKMMTLYLVFEDMKAGRITKRTRLKMSRRGAQQQPSKIGLRPGQTISMEQAILALVTKSANDVATAIGDQLSGSEAAFAVRMTRKARQLGMSRTTFKNANGLTARGQITTAADMAKLGLALREHFPREYGYFKTRVFKLGKRRYGNHNRLLGRVRGVDGIKTGYTRASGFNLVSSVSSRGRRIVAVVMGGRTGRSRNAHMRKLIARYLPKASRGAARQLVAKARPSRSGRAVQITKVTTPTLLNRQVRKVGARVARAHAIEQPEVADIAEVKRMMLALAAGETPTPAQRAISTHGFDDVVTASVAPKQSESIDGWQIQIAATDRRDGALDLLAKARSRNEKLLKNRITHTPRVEKNGSVFYRARFAGFPDKKSARRACRILKRQRVDCLAISG